LIFELAVAVLIGSLVLAPRAPLTRAMATRPMTWTGQRAYGLYLIHPIVYQYLGEFGLGDWFAAALRVTVVFVGAWFSYRFIEAPALRLKDRFSTGPLIARA
jgi:peptidoglycan/LPS O-acetylase OafA/YrhL